MMREQREPLIERDKEMIPTVLLRAMFGLVVACFLLVAYASFTDRQLEAMPPDLAVTKERDIRIFASMTGEARVETPSGEVIANLDTTKGGFVAGIGRVLERERGKVGLDASLPIRLIQYSDGRLALRDAHTPWRAELRGFGQTNEITFLNILNN